MGGEGERGEGGRGPHEELRVNFCRDCMAILR